MQQTKPPVLNIIQGVQKKRKSFFTKSQNSHIPDKRCTCIFRFFGYNLLIMKLFMVTLLPLCLVYMLKNNNGQSSAPYTSILAGLIFGALYSFIDCMFTSSYYLIRYAFFPNYGFYVFFEVVLPCLCCAGLSLIFIKNRSQILLSFGFVIAAFYAVYMPARIIHRNDAFDWYLLFVKPVIYTAMVIGIKNTAVFLHKTVKEAASRFLTAVSAVAGVKFFIFPVSLMLCVLIIPPAIDVMNLLNLPFWIILPAGFCYGIFVFAQRRIILRIKTV